MFRVNSFKATLRDSTQKNKKRVPSFQNLSENADTLTKIELVKFKREEDDETLELDDLDDRSNISSDSEIRTGDELTMRASRRSVHKTTLRAVQGDVSD
jgi:hypothetical protein